MLCLLDRPASRVSPCIFAFLLSFAQGCSGQSSQSEEPDPDGGDETVGEDVDDSGSGGQAGFDASGGMVNSGVGGAVDVSPGSGGTPHLDPDPEPEPEPERTYSNPLDVSMDLAQINAALSADGTDSLLSITQTGCFLGSCLAVLHDYEGQNLKDRKVNGEFSFGAFLTEATFVYRVKFESGFDFRKQGKLPGVTPQAPHFGGNKNDPPHPEKWSARVMWLKTGDADLDGTVKPDLYLYDQDRQQGQTGEHNNKPGFSFVTDEWHTVALYVKLNSDGNTRDGRAELWVDGELMSCRTNKRFRGQTGQSTEIQRLAFHNYFGGGADYDWPKQEQYAFFDELEIFPGRQTPAVPTSGECDDSIRNQ